MTQLLDDRTWDRLDSSAGRMSARERRLVTRLVLAVVVVVVAAAGVGWSGLLWPRLGTSADGQSSWDTATRTFTVTVVVMNRGSRTEHLVAAGRGGPGLRLTRVAGLPVDIPRQTGVGVELHYRITDCAAVPTASWPVPVTVRRPWGAVTTHVTPPGGVGESAPDGYSFSGSTDPYAVSWQRYYADKVCGTR